jgi:hypothetical protein
MRHGQTAEVRAGEAVANVRPSVRLSSLTHEDLQLFRLFLQDPQPRSRWVADGGRKYPRHAPRWRPFYGALAASSQRQAMVILNALFAWLVEAGYLATRCRCPASAPAAQSRASRAISIASCGRR